MKTLLAAIFLTVALLDAAHAQSPAALKPPIGVPADAVPFNGRWYRVYLEKCGCLRARASCSALGGQLASVSDEPTHIFIQQLAKGLTLWLGATDEKTEGAWVWPNGKEMTFKAWAPGENLDNRQENFLVIREGLWYDYSKTGIGAGFICEWHAK